MLTQSLNRNLILTLLFSVAAAVFLIFENYLIFLLPVLLFGIFAVFYKPDWAFYMVVFFMPLSVNTEEFMASPMALFVPTEPILIALMMVYFYSHQVQPMFERKIFSHPVFIAYCIYLCWLFLSSITSMQPMVSLKFLIAHCWLFFPIFIFSAQLFSSKKAILRFLWLMIIPMTGVAAFTIYKHSWFAFGEKAAHWVMSPFFKDHTSYGAILALLFPMIIGLLVIYKKKVFVSTFLYFILIIFTAALVFSYTRAAWLSLVAALGILTVIYFKIRFSTILIVSFGVLFFLAVSFDKILMSLEQNQTDSSADFGKHLTSMSNISTDASNVERLNRWDCAIEMFKQKPLSGWGPGTYQFYYAPFQREENLTIISTNFGDGGNAHSEYLGPLAESGFPGLIFFLIAIGVLFYRAFSNYRSIEDEDVRVLYISAVLGLSTYFIHGVLNNYLDTDKAAVPVWGIAGLVAAVDIYHARKKAIQE